MINRKNLAVIQNEMAFTMELWKLVLEAEELVRNHYLKLVEREIYDLDDEDSDPTL